MKEKKEGRKEGRKEGSKQERKEARKKGRKEERKEIYKDCGVGVVEGVVVVVMVVVWREILYTPKITSGLYLRFFSPFLLFSPLFFPFKMRAFQGHCLGGVS